VLYIVSWRGRPESRNAAADRFKKTGGAPPAGVKVIGRWHTVGPLSGVAIAEASDPIALEKWVLEWNDLFEMDVHAALTDEQLGQALAAV
jgi:hypothetical protein